MAGSLCSIFIAQGLLQKFSGKGLVPDQVVTSPALLLAVALGAGLTVILATLTGFPVSTTHGLTGAIIGSGLVAVGSRVDFSTLGKAFVLSLLLSPILAVAVGACLYLSLRLVRLRTGVTKEWCLCVGHAEIHAWGDCVRHCLQCDGHGTKNPAALAVRSINQ